MLSGLGNLEACFLFGIKAFFIEHRGYNDLQHTAEGGHDAAACLYASCSTETMVVPPPTTLRRGT
jgi:hypothetical protein